MAVVDKNVLGLLNGLAKREYYEEEGITNEFLHEELFSDMEVDAFKILLARFENIMRTMVSSDMDFRQLEAFLTSQMQRKEKSIEEGQAVAISRFWKNHKSKIHNVMVERSIYGNRLKQVNWRIDLKTNARHIDQLNTPVAIYELEIEQQSQKGNSNKADKIRFEMDSEQLEETLAKFQKIKDIMNQLGSN